jgi:hypothetical protein
MTQLITFATVLNVLSQPALGNGLLWMARAMSGEQGGVFPDDMQDEIGLWIAHAILNRVQSEAYPSEPEASVTSRPATVICWRGCITWLFRLW